MVCLATMAVTGCSDDDDEGAPVVSLVPREAEGTCLNFTEEVGAEVTELPVVECAVPHSHEIIAVALSAEPVYPGFEALEAEAQRDCFRAFEPYVNTNPFDSELFVSWLLPTLTSWEKNDRQIVCVVGNTNDAPLVGTVKDSSR
ncbi:MAG TPA: septum formation family protein [Ilumatobacter sp.]|jgi:hypothetical protein|nr:septum formation family protein [Ilumatobacter sp.]